MWRFYGNCVILPKTRAGGASPVQKWLPPKKVFLDPARFCPKPKWVVLPQRKSDLHPKRFSSSKRIFFKRRNAVACPDAISPNGETPFLTPARFPQTAKCRSLPKRIFPERQNAVACPDAFSTNGKMPLLVLTRFPLTAKRRRAKKRVFFLSVLNFFRYLIK